jgi:predicted DNA-binding transcriptional regulator AlpA
MPPTETSPSAGRADSAPLAPTLPLLVRQKQAIAYVGVSRAGWFRLRAGGKLPEPASVPGSGLVWRRADLDRWVQRLGPAKPRRRANHAV